MKKRYLYTLLFFLPGALFSLIAATLVFGAAAGVLWVFIFGDNTWPEYAGNGLTVLYATTFLTGWLASLFLGYRTGQQLEADPQLNKKHILASIVLTFIPLLIVVLHQWGVGNIGRPHDSIICGDYCLAQGYPSSGMPPRDSGDYSCICYDNGKEVIKMPMEEIISKQ